MIQDGATARGSVNTVRRVGNTIRRPSGPWTPTVHALLHHLERNGFEGAPRVLGIDEEGQEMLSLLEGEPARRPWPKVLLEAKGLVALVRWLHEYHAAVSDFEPPEDAEWFVPDIEWRPGQIVRHGDLGPWNSIWRGEELTGLIDWEFAEPGEPGEDVAQLAWYAVPLRGGQKLAQSGFERAPDLRDRLRVFCDAYGTEPEAVLDSLQALQTKESNRTMDLASGGLEPWVSFRDRGDLEEFASESEWLRENRERLLS